MNRPTTRYCASMGNLVKPGKPFANGPFGSRRAASRLAADVNHQADVAGDQFIPAVLSSSARSTGRSPVCPWEHGSGWRGFESHLHTRQTKRPIDAGIEGGRTMSLVAALQRCWRGFQENRPAMLTRSRR
jgi:hypothetical protein